MFKIKRVYRPFFYIFFSCFYSLGFPVTQEVYSFDSLKEELAFQSMIRELRCLVCQNQNLSDSDALLAKDLRQVIYQRLKKGDKPLHIKKYLVSRYGEFILLKPNFTLLTFWLWIGPFVLLAGIIGRCWIRLKE